VRGIANLHIRVMATAEAAGRRFLALADGPTISVPEMAQIPRERLGRWQSWCRPKKRRDRSRPD
jgi:hypothetical protein